MDVRGLRDLEVEGRRLAARQREALGIPGRARRIVAGGADGRILGGVPQPLRGRLVLVGHDLLLPEVLARAVARLALHAVGRRDGERQRLRVDAIRRDVTREALRRLGGRLRDAVRRRDRARAIFQQRGVGVRVRILAPRGGLVPDQLLAVTAVAFLQPDEGVLDLRAGLGGRGRRDAQDDEQSG